MSRKKTLVSVKATSHERYAWVATYKQGGRRERRYFNTKAEANAFASEKGTELLNVGRKHGEITEEERQAVIRARDMAEAFAAKGFKGFTLDAALKHYAAHLDACRVSVPVLDAYDAFHAYKKSRGKSDRYLADIASRVQAFAKKHKKKLVAEITRQDVDAYLNNLGLAPLTLANHHRMISVFLNWCKEQPRSWATENAAEGWEAPTVKGKKPGTLTIAETRALLAAAAPEIVPALAISLFAGLRRAEVERLDWQAVKFENEAIEVSYDDKTGRRMVPMPANLIAWLTPHRQPAGPVMPEGELYRNRLEDARTDAGLKKWPHNACRHSCASYLYDLLQDAGKVAVRLGHDVRTLEKHYRDLVLPGQGKAFFAILPSKAGNIISMRRAAV